MADTTITSANSKLYITVSGLFPAPVAIRGFSSDKAFMTDALDLAEASMGVDGRMTAGYTPNVTKQTITLQADSPSRPIFSAIVQAMKTSQEIFYLQATLSIPSIGEYYEFTKGALTNAKQLPDGQKVLQPMDFVITWESVNRSLL